MRSICSNAIVSTYFATILLFTSIVSSTMLTVASPILPAHKEATTYVHDVSWQLVEALRLAGLGKREASRVMVRTIQRSGKGMTDKVKAHLEQTYGLQSADIEAAVELAIAYRVHPRAILSLKKLGHTWTEVEDDIATWVHVAALAELRTHSNSTIALYADMARLFDVSPTVLETWAHYNADLIHMAYALYYTYMFDVPRDEIEKKTFWPENEQRIERFANKFSLKASRFLPTMTKRIHAAGMEIMHPDPITIDPALGYNTATHQPNTEHFVWHTANHTEKVHPETGSLVVTHTDMVLPGPNGFDLKLSRIYNSNTARVYDQAMAHTQLEYAMDGAIEHIGAYTDDNGELWECFHEIFPHMARYTGATYEWFRFCENQHTGESRWEEGVAKDPGWPIVTFNYTVTRSPLFAERYGLGVGWSYGFPMLEIIANEQFGDDMYLHMGDGRIFQVTAPDGGNGSRHNPHLHMTFALDDTYDNGQQPSEYALHLQHGVTYYFSATGEILGIEDRFGNTINFTYYTRGKNRGKLHSIDDAAGRTVHFTYTRFSFYSVVEVHVVANDEATSTPIARYVVHHTEQSQQLVSAQLANGEEMAYEYEEIETKFRYAYDIDDGGNTATNVYVALTSIKSHCAHDNQQWDVTEYVWERPLPRKGWIARDAAHPNATVSDNNWQQYIRVHRRLSSGASP